MRHDTATRLWKCRAHGNHRTISTAAWKSRTDREIPTFPQPIIWYVRSEERRMNRPQVVYFPSGQLVYFSSGARMENGGRASFSRCSPRSRVLLW